MDESSNAYIFPACENVESKHDKKTWFWTECLNDARSVGCKVGTTEFWTIYKIRVYETHGSYGYCVAGIDKLAEDVGVSPDQMKRTLENLCRKGRLFHIWCDRKVYRNKTKLFVTKQWCEERGINPEMVKVLAKGKKNENSLALKATSENVETTSENVVFEKATSQNVEATSENVVSPLMNKYKRISKSTEQVKMNKRRFEKPTVYEVAEYCKSRKNSVDPEAFVDFYESKGWVVGKTPMKDWKAAVRTWERNGYSNTKQNTKSIIYEAKDGEDVTYKEMFVKWKKYLGTTLAQTSEQVAACKDLVADVGEVWVEKMIVALRMRSQTNYVTREVKAIQDFVGLANNRNLIMSFYDEHWKQWQELQRQAQTGKKPWEPI